MGVESLDELLKKLSQTVKANRVALQRSLAACEKNGKRGGSITRYEFRQAWKSIPHRFSFAEMSAICAWVNPSADGLIRTETFWNKVSLLEDFDSADRTHTGTLSRADFERFGGYRGGGQSHTPPKQGGGAWASPPLPRGALASVERRLRAQQPEPAVAGADKVQKSSSNALFSSADLVDRFLTLASSSSTSPPALALPSSSSPPPAARVTGGMRPALTGSQAQKGSGELLPSLPRDFSPPRPAFSLRHDRAALLFQSGGTSGGRPARGRGGLQQHDHHEQLPTSSPSPAVGVIDQQRDQYNGGLVGIVGERTVEGAAVVHGSASRGGASDEHALGIEQQLQQEVSHRQSMEMQLLQVRAELQKMQQGAAVPVPSQGFRAAGLMDEPSTLADRFNEQMQQQLLGKMHAAFPGEMGMLSSSVDDFADAVKGGPEPEESVQNVMIMLNSLKGQMDRLLGIPVGSPL